MQNKNFLILGGSSYLGSNMYKFLINKNISVTSTYYTNQVTLSNFKKCNLCSYKSLEKLPRHDVVILYAANVLGKNKLKNNRKIIKNVIKYVIENKSFLVFISSSQVNFKYDTNYKASKIDSEELVKSKLRNYLIIRPALPIGNYNFKLLKTKRLQPIELLINLMKKVRIAPIIGNGTQLRQPIYITDLNKIIFQLIKSKIKNKIVEIGGPDKLTYNQMISLMSKKIGISVLKLRLPYLLFYYLSFLFNTIDKDNLRNTIVSEIVDNKSWQELGPEFKLIKLKKMKSISF
tara:strand:+ start:6107 stop:6976 length:870 start_codon:yes stop_codon:yes gene_type:complete